MTCDKNIFQNFIYITTNIAIGTSMNLINKYFIFWMELPSENDHSPESEFLFHFNKLQPNHFKRK